MVIHVTNFKDLNAELLQLLEEAMLDIAIDAQRQLSDDLQRMVYDAYHPKFYHRTGDLKRSIDADVHQVKNVVSAEVFHNPNLINPIAPYDGNNNIGQHYSTYKYSPMPYNEFVAETVNFGISKGKRKVFGDGVYARKRPYFDTAQKVVETGFRSNLKNHLARNGGFKVV
jgi:hypothetical protein